MVLHCLERTFLPVMHMQWNIIEPLKTEGLFDWAGNIKPTHFQLFCCAFWTYSPRCSANTTHPVFSPCIKMGKTCHLQSSSIWFFSSLCTWHWISSGVFESLTPTNFHPFNPTQLKHFGSLSFAKDKHREYKVASLAWYSIFMGLEDVPHVLKLWDDHCYQVLITCILIYQELGFSALDCRSSCSIDSSQFILDFRVQQPTLNSVDIQTSLPPLPDVLESYLKEENTRSLHFFIIWSWSCEKIQ